MHAKQQSTVVARAVAIALTLAAAFGEDAAAQTTTRTTAFEYDAFGQRVKQITEPEGDINTVRHAEVTVRDPGTGVSTKRQWLYRDPQTGTDVLREVESANYDPRFRFPVETFNAKLHKETRAYDEGSGALLSLTGPNGLITSWTYDAWGRKTREDRPDGSSLTYAYRTCVDACANGARRVLITQSWFGSSQREVPVEEFFDALDRRVQTRTWGFKGEQILTDRIFDGKGRIDRVSRPRFAGAGQVFVSFTHDDLGRTVEIRTPTATGGTDLSTQTFSGQMVTRVNAKGQRRVEIRNGMGPLRAVRDDDGFTTTFVNDGFNALTRVIDARGNEIRIDRDVLGRRTRLIDPDMGTRTFAVNPLGQLYRQTDAKGQVTTMEFDALGRMTRRLASDQDARWEFDTAVKGIGRLAEASTWMGANRDYRQVFEYDSVGRPWRVTASMDWNYVTEYAFDLLGRPATTLYRRRPLDTLAGVNNGFSVQYNAYGYASGVLWISDRGIGTFLTRKAMSAEGVVTEEELGNGMVRRRKLNAYTGRLEGIAVGMGGSTNNRQSDVYAHDALGNLVTRSQSISSGGPLLTEVFSYDGMNRLASSQVAGQSPKTFGYDAIGNLVSRTGVGQYTYPASGAGSVRPHAVSQIQTAGPVAGVTNPGFSYDDSGNLVEGLGRRYGWTSFDQASSIDRLSGSAAVQRTAFVFGPERQRLRQIVSPMSGGAPGSPTTTIYYAGGLEKEIDVAANRTIIRAYMPGGLGYLEERLTGTAVAPGDQVMRTQRYFLNDHLGSLVAVADESGNLFNRLSYDPWGRRRGVDGADDAAGASGFGSIKNTQDHSGYTGQEQLDQLALVHLNGRVYDPIVGRMVSADPTVPNADDGQEYNRYSYVLNNALAFIDPTGFGSDDPLPRMKTDGGFVNGISIAQLLAAQEQAKQEPIVLPPSVTVGKSTTQLVGIGFAHLSDNRAFRVPDATLPKINIGPLLRAAAPLLLPVSRFAALMLFPSNFAQNDPCKTGSLCAPPLE
ncbi:RHS repeat domain-containing protein [Roseateles chitinivorans]|uniref:RHS repeat domain-containing protein n=1 Tax=Roseateles chitinivorans TaxID=2917965 RepID=UPI003D66C819